ncbi:MAG: hypothetical protein AAFY88_29275, partial [Acidobacteriota bacterium]
MIQLSQDLVAGGDVIDFIITADGAHVLFRADAELDQKIELYRVPIAGGGVEKMNGPMVPAGDVFDYVMTPDLTHVVYSATQNDFRRRELYSRSLSSGSVAKLNGPIGIDEFAGHLTPTSDSARVVYTVGVGPPNITTTLHSAPIGGGTPSVLDTAGVGEDFFVTADNQRVIYLTDQGRPTLYSVPMTGGAPTDLAGPNFELRRGLYATSDRATAFFFGEEGQASVRLFTLDVSSGAVERLDDDPAADSYGVDISADDSTVLYCAGGDLRAIRLDGGASSSVFDLCRRFQSTPLLTADGTRAVSFDGDRLLAAPTDGSAAARELTDFSPQGAETVPDVRFDASGDRVVYVSDHVSHDRYELYSVPWAGGPPSQLNESTSH